MPRPVWPGRRAYSPSNSRLTDRGHERAHSSPGRTGRSEWERASPTSMRRCGASPHRRALQASLARSLRARSHRRRHATTRAARAAPRAGCLPHACAGRSRPPGWHRRRRRRDSTPLGSSMCRDDRHCPSSPLRAPCGANPPTRTGSPRHASRHSRCSTSHHEEERRARPQVLLLESGRVPPGARRTLERLRATKARGYGRRGAVATERPEGDANSTP